MQLDWFTFVVQIINFLILIVLLKRFLYKPVITVMKKRQEEVANRLEEARLKLADAENMASEYEQKLQKMETEHDEWVQQAREEVEHEKAELLKKARQEVESYQKRWRDAVESEKIAFVRNLETRIADKIILLVGKIVNELANRSLEEQAIEKFIDMVQSLDEQDRKKMEVIGLNSAIKELTIVSSFPLEGPSKQKILDHLQELFHDKVPYRFITSNIHGFGIEIRTGEWQLGWNTKAYLEDLKTQLLDAFEKPMINNHNLETSA